MRSAHGNTGISLIETSYTLVAGNTVIGGEIGVFVGGDYLSVGNVITGNYVANQTKENIVINGSLVYDNSFYNNYFAGPKCFFINTSCPNKWNTEKTPGRNIIGGPTSAGTTGLATSAEARIETASATRPSN